MKKSIHLRQNQKIISYIMNSHLYPYTFIVKVLQKRSNKEQHKLEGLLNMINTKWDYKPTQFVHVYTEWSALWVTLAS